MVYCKSHIKRKDKRRKLVTPMFIGCKSRMKNCISVIINCRPLVPIVGQGFLPSWPNKATDFPLISVCDRLFYSSYWRGDMRWDNELIASYSRKNINSKLGIRRAASLCRDQVADGDATDVGFLSSRSTRLYGIQSHPKMVFIVLFLPRVRARSDVASSLLFRVLHEVQRPTILRV